jgi:F-type H+-transporting ATPase subunit b
VNINLTLIGQMIAFVCFVMFCMKYVWPPILAAMAEREKKIADGLAAADRASHDLELANKRGIQLVEEAKASAVVEADRVKTAAKAEIEQETNRAREQLRGQVAALALAGAEKVLGASIDQKAHAELVNKLAAEL